MRKKVYGHLGGWTCNLFKEGVTYGKMSLLLNLRFKKLVEVIQWGVDIRLCGSRGLDTDIDLTSWPSQTNNHL